MVHKKLILINWHYWEIKKLAKAFRDRNCETVAARPSWTEDFQKEFPEMMRLDDLNSKRWDFPGKYRYSNYGNLEPPGKEIIEELSKEESITLAMMTRSSPRGAHFYVRKRTYYNRLALWYGILRKLRPDAILFNEIPHGFSDYILYTVARASGIQTLMLRSNIPPNNRYRILVDDIEKESRILQNELEGTRAAGIEDINEEMREYYTNGRTRKNFFKKLQKNKEDAYLVNYRVSLMHRIWNSKKIFFPKSGLAYRRKLYTKPYFFLKYIYREYRKECFKREYESIQSEADLKAKFVLVPLHYQPECTTIPMGGIFADQLLMIRLLSFSVPSDWLIYVKEHNPPQWEWKTSDVLTGRYPGYYKEMAALPNVRLISPKILAMDLINSSKAVATVTGTAALEAILNAKPAMVFGYPAYLGLNQIFRVSDVQSIRSAIAQIEQGYKPDEGEVLRYLLALQRASIDGWQKSNMNDKWEIHEKGFDRIADAVTEEMKSFHSN